MPSTVLPAGISNIESRISEIQSRMNPQQSASATAFADQLSAALGSTTDSSTSFSASSFAGGNVSGGDIVADAQKYLGVPYVYGGNDPATGLDCSSLVQKVYGDFGITLPRVAADQAREGTAVASLAQAKPGDLVAFGSPVDHIGIYAGNNKMIVAPHTGDVVKVQDVYTTPTAIRRILPDNTSFNLASFSSVTSSLGALSSQYDAQFQAAGAKYGISPNLLAAVAKAESNFNANARSGAGAIGLMQLMPGTAKSLGVDPSNPSQAIDGAAKMLSGLVKKFGSTSLAVAAYNAGPGAVQQYNGIPPYAETQNYVKKVLSYASQGVK